MQNVQYKGFTIFAANRDGNGTRYFVEGTGFKAEGYPTLNHAKGAITNHLKAQEMKAAIAAEVFPAEAQAELENEGLSHLTQVLAHHGLISKAATQSRNKREGHYFGKIAGVEHRGSPRKRTFPVSAGSMQNTRKQRKALKLDARAHVRFLASALQAPVNFFQSF